MCIETESAHITPVGGNVFEDLGFAQDEAAKLKEESQRIIAEKHPEITKLAGPNPGPS